MNPRKLTTMAMLAALSVLLVAVIHLPLIPTASFLEYDPADIPILIATFAYGPAAGLAVTVVASVIQGLTVSSVSGVYGIIMHIIATGTYVLVAGLIYKRKKTRLNAGISLAAGTAAMAAVMAGANLIVTPLFLGTPVEVVQGMLLPAIIPFNLLKAGINGLVTFIVYKPISGIIKDLGDAAAKAVKE